jgi:hypothetical protein
MGWYQIISKLIRFCYPYAGHTPLYIIAFFELFVVVFFYRGEIWKSQMFKSSLQEPCLERRWPLQLPVYSVNMDLIMVGVQYSVEIGNVLFVTATFCWWYVMKLPGQNPIFLSLILRNFGGSTSDNFNTFW